MWNQGGSFICLDLMVKIREVLSESGELLPN
jgi:hypothetical protein